MPFSTIATRVSPGVAFTTISFCILIPALRGVRRGSGGTSNFRVRHWQAGAQAQDGCGLSRPREPGRTPSGEPRRAEAPFRADGKLSLSSRITKVKALTRSVSQLYRDGLACSRVEPPRATPRCPSADPGRSPGAPDCVARRPCQTAQTLRDRTVVDPMGEVKDGSSKHPAGRWGGSRTPWPDRPPGDSRPGPANRRVRGARSPDARRQPGRPEKASSPRGRLAIEADAARHAAKPGPPAPGSGGECDRRGAAHEPRPRCAGPPEAARAVSGSSGVRLQRSRARSRRAAPAADRQRGVWRRSWCCLSGAEAALAVNNNAAAAAAGARHPRPGARGDRLARRAGRDRRLLPGARDPGARRRAPGGGGHHEPHPSAGLRSRRSGPRRPSS